MGAPLATFRRRLGAMVLDTLVFGIIIGTLFVGLTCLSLYHEDPTFFPRLKSVNGKTDQDELSRARKQLSLDFLKLVDKRCPDAFSSEIKTFIAEDNAFEAGKVLPLEELAIGFGSGPTKATQSNGQTTLSLGTDLVLGSASSVMSWGAFFVGWFTVWTRLGKGRTFGKKLLGIQVIRLDDKPLTWWDCFSRAGGYGASAATLFLGFLEAIFHPNRQAIHDRISGTVVIRK